MKNSFLSKKPFIAFAFITASVGMPNIAHAEEKTVQGFASLVSPIIIGTVIPFNFGDVVPSANAGTVVLSTSGSRTASGGASLGNGTLARAGYIPMIGSPSGTVTLTLSGAVTMAEVGDSTKTLTVDNFTVKIGASGTEQAYSSPINAALNASDGRSEVNIGGTLNIPANIPVGDYATNHTGGTPLTVTIAYN